MTQRLVPFTALVLALTAGCVTDLGFREEGLDHAIHEVTVSSDEMASWRTEGEWLVSPALEAHEGASRVGMLLNLIDVGAVLPIVEARALEAGAPVGDWMPLELTWNEEDQMVAIAELGTIGDGAELRVHASGVPGIRLLHWTAVIPEVPVEAPVEEVGVASAELRTELRGLGIISREEWGARATRCTTPDARRYRMAIHHTVTNSSNSLSQVRGIQRFHMDSRGWCDVGYHFLIGHDGRIYEARPLNLLGAHVGSNNSGNIGISFVGCYHTSGCGGLGPTTPSAAALESAGRLMGTLSRLYGITLNTTNVRGHRAHAGAGTSCPGDNLASRIGDLIATGRARTLGGGPAPAPAPSPSPSAGATCRHTYGGTYASGACSASYQCCDGRWRERGAGCGACLCIESSGETGCTASPTAPLPAAPPPGASCGHTYGGRYANTACSASYQCCDGRWRERGAGCGACFCTEGTGERGCGL
jgi:hypothetical protein